MGQVNIGVGGVKKASKIYTGVGGVVKEIKSGKCGVGGVVKEFYASAYGFYNYGSNNVNFKSSFSTALPITFNSNHMALSYTSNGGWTSGSYSSYFDWPIVSGTGITDLTSLDKFTKFVLVVDTKGVKANQFGVSLGFTFGSTKQWADVSVGISDCQVKTGEQRLEVTLSDKFKSDFKTKYTAATDKTVYVRLGHAYSSNVIENDDSSDEYYYYYKPLDIYYVGLE